jgi:hypothetical protein
MSRLSETVRDRIATSSKNALDVAVAIHNAIEAGGKTRLDFKTVQEKLSKLVNADPEGELFFLAAPERLDALASALGICPERLRELREVVDLILDPALPREVRDYFEGRQSVEVGFRCVSVAREATGREDVREALRLAARRASLPVVVLSSERDRDFFKGAGIPTSVVRSQRRGYVLAEAEDLVPVPEPAAPVLWDGAGVPMAPCGELAEYVADATRRNGHCDDRLRRSLSEAEERDSVPTFYLEEIWGYLKNTRELPPLAVAHQWLTEEGILWAPSLAHVSSHVNLPEVCIKVLFGQSSLTVAWGLGSKVYGIGPSVCLLRDLLAPHHEVERPSALDRLLDARGKLNPWRFGPPDPPTPEEALRQRFQAATRGPCTQSGEERPSRSVDASHPWNELRHDLRECTGLDFDQAVPSWRAGVDLAKSQDRATWDVSFDESATEYARTRLLSLAKRRFEVPISAASLPFQLEAAASAPMAIVEPEEFERAHVIVNMGAGHLLRLRFMEFSDEKEKPVRVDRYALDGGDVRMWVFAMYDAMLEGTHLAGRARRRAQARQRDDDD